MERAPPQKMTEKKSGFFAGKFAIADTLDDVAGM
jgi:hypothetical protein